MSNKKEKEVGNVDDKRIEQLVQKARKTTMDVNDVGELIAALRESQERARVAEERVKELEPDLGYALAYGEHKTSCGWDRRSLDTCTCGFTALLRKYIFTGPIEEPKP